jgi:hypothetical protein
MRIWSLYREQFWGPSELDTIRQQSSSTCRATPEDFQYMLPNIIAAGMQEKKHIMRNMDPELIHLYFFEGGLFVYITSNIMIRTKLGTRSFNFTFFLSFRFFHSISLFFLSFRFFHSGLRRIKLALPASLVFLLLIENVNFCLKCFFFRTL